MRRGGGSRQELPPPQLWRSKGVSPGKFFENIGANLCNLVHFWRVQQKTYNSVFNLDFGRSIWWHQVIKTGTENRRYRLCRTGSAAPCTVLGNRNFCSGKSLSSMGFAHPNRLCIPHCVAPSRWRAPTVDADSCDVIYTWISGPRFYIKNGAMLPSSGGPRILKGRAG